MKTLWSDTASLVRLAIGDDERELISEGPLWKVLLHLETWTADKLAKIFVALPDRGAAPYRLDASALRSLLDDPKRPRVRPLTLRQTRIGFF